MNNPVFKEANKIIIEENCEEVIYMLVYQLKNISNAFYLSCLIRNKDIQIFKYSYETKSFKNIGKIDVICSYNESMKYFYNPLNNKEYFFFISAGNELEIYLIKDENNFKKIHKLNYINNGDIDDNNNNNILEFDNSDGPGDDLDDSLSGGGGFTFANFNFFNVFYNQNDKNVYVIVNYLIMQNPGGGSSFDGYSAKSINIFIFKDEKLNLIKTFKFDIEFNLSNIIYTKNDCNKKYLIDLNQNKNLILIELKSDYNNYQIENVFNDEINKNKISNFIRSQYCYDICIIYGKNNFDYLYIIQSNGDKLMIINFTEKTIDKIIDFHELYFTAIHYWNKNYLCLFFWQKGVYIFDTLNNKIIHNYKKKDCRGFQSHLLQGKDEGIALFRYYDKIECYFI